MIVACSLSLLTFSVGGFSPPFLVNVSSYVTGDVTPSGKRYPSAGSAVTVTVTSSSPTFNTEPAANTLPSTLYTTPLMSGMVYVSASSSTVGFCGVATLSSSTAVGSNSTFISAAEPKFDPE